MFGIGSNPRKTDRIVDLASTERDLIKRAQILGASLVRVPDYDGLLGKTGPRRIAMAQTCGASLEFEHPCYLDNLTAPHFQPIVSIRPRKSLETERRYLQRKLAQVQAELAKLDKKKN